MKQINAILIGLMLAICVSAAGCVFVRSSAISDRTAAGAPLAGSASDYGYLELIAPTGLTQAALANVLGNCATGKMTGVVTELQVRDFFIVQYYTVSVSGSCI
jgi:hypothetical protein